MHKGVLAYVLVLAVIIILTFVSLPRQQLPGGQASTTTVAKGTNNSITGENSTNSTGNSTNTTPPPTNKCESLSNTTAIPNGNFGTGTFANWTVEGNGFGTNPTNISYANLNNLYFNTSWTNYKGGYFATTFQGFTVHPGNLTSDPFKVTQPYLNFQLVSPQNSDIYIEILSNGKPVLRTNYNTYAVAKGGAGNSMFENASIPVQMFICQDIQIKIVTGVLSQRTTSNEYLAIGNFYLSKVPVKVEGIIVNQTIV